VCLRAVVFEKFCVALGCTKPYPLTAVRSVGVLLSPDGYWEIGGENLQVLLILRRKAGKCRSHIMCFGVMERVYEAKRAVPYLQLISRYG